MAFRTACHAAARSTRGRVGDVTSAGVTPNFHTARITTPYGVCTVLCHAVLPVVAFTAYPPRAGAPVTDFLSPPAWADVFGAVGFQVLDAEELTMPLASVHTGELAEAELEQVRHWRPGTVGELMFNWWD